MHQHLELLIQLNDLDDMIKEYKNVEVLKTVEKIGFQIEKLEELEKAHKNVRAQLPSDLLRRYDSIALKHKGRVVVPVHKGICLGCFMSMPTSLLARLDQNKTVRTCANCGRFLYWIHETK